VTVGQWYNVCLASMRPWVLSLALQKERKVILYCVIYEY
jgi:hypothetical protein